jgi:hypothetical protein
MMLQRYLKVTDDKEMVTMIVTMMLEMKMMTDNDDARKVVTISSC